MTQLTAIDRKILNRTQKEFPLCSEPFKQIADELGIEKSFLLERIRLLKSQGIISRFGGVNSHKKMGYSTLAALKVPMSRLDEVAAMVSLFDEVNHNYQREHVFNLWFVVTAESQERLETVLEEIRLRSGCQLLDLPMEKSFYIDLAFPL